MSYVTFNAILLFVYLNDTYSTKQFMMILYSKTWLI